MMKVIVTNHNQLIQVSKVMPISRILVYFSPFGRFDDLSNILVGNHLTRRCNQRDVDMCSSHIMIQTFLQQPFFTYNGGQKNRSGTGTSRFTFVQRSTSK